MVVAHYASSGARGQSDTSWASESANMPNSDLSFVHQANNTKSQSLELIRRHDNPSVSSVRSLVRRKPLPPNACRPATSLSSPENPTLSSELSQQVSSLQSWTSDVSFLPKIDFPPWEGANFTSAEEVQGFTDQNTNISQQRNTLPCQMSQSLAISKLPSSSFIFPDHSRSLSSASVLSEETTRTISTVCCDHPGSTAASSIRTPLLFAETTPSRQRITTLSCPKDSADPDLSPSESSMMSSKPSMVASLFSWREKVSTPMPSTSTSIESSSPKLPYTPEKDHNHLSLSSTSNEKSYEFSAPTTDAQSHVALPITGQKLIKHEKRSPPNMDDMERELREISSELAASIKREMDLEDEVDRLKADAQISSDVSEKRTSDYFSDSGSSSIKFGGELESKRDELDRSIRKAELSKAQMKLEITQLTMTVNEERAKRKQLEQKIRDLEEKAMHINQESPNSTHTSERVRELESTCEELRKQLAEEQQLKDATSKTLAGLRSQLQVSLSERDNLRDEVVPQLRSQIEGLEIQATEHERTTYEQTKVHQVLQELGNKSMALIDSQKKQIERQHQNKKNYSFSQIIEAVEKTDSISYDSNPISKVRPRSNTMNVTENRDRTAERIRDVELQRDALHDSLRSLRERQEHQNRENQKHIKHLEMELEKALSVSPKRSGYEREVKQMRAEINTLRLRADEAISQKLKLTENITVLKYELERAEQEIVTLKKLLMLEKHVSQVSQKRPISGILVSESLEDSYKDLQITFSKALERAKCLQTEKMSQEDLHAFRLMEQSFERAISERNFVSYQAEILRKQNKILLQNEKAHSAQELTHSQELLDSARRFEDLAIQVRQQLNTNATLRQRLASMIEREEKEQELSAQKIKHLQERVKVLEEQIYIAQNSSEERLLTHEEEIREMKENQIDQLLRIKEGIRSPNTSVFARSIKSPKNFFIQSPVSEDIKIAQLRQRISELEKALSDANLEIAKVVSHLNASQVQVMDLQNEREEAIQETKRLQRLVEQEKAQAYSMTWASMLSFRGKEVKA